MVCQNETATGVKSDVAGVRKILDDLNHPALLMVDGVSSPYIKTWNYDIAKPTDEQLETYNSAATTEDNNCELIYLDNGATTHKPKIVLERLDKFYKEENSNIHRGVHYLSQLASEKYENARSSLKSYINASLDEEIIFTKGTTESINLVANSYK